MKHAIGIFAFLGIILMAGSASAQLPSNPWAPHPNDG